MFTFGQKSEVGIQKIPLSRIEASVIESKDVLLQMLEKKLKEIKDSKKLRNGNGDVLPKNVDFNLKSNGISAVGESELVLKYGKNGQGIVNLTSEGISNVGKVQLLMGTGNNGLRLSGLANLFSGSSIRSGDQNDDDRLQLPNQNDISLGFRRQTNVSGGNDTDIVKVGTETVEAIKGDKAEVKAAKVETPSNAITDTKDGETNGTTGAKSTILLHETVNNNMPDASSHVANSDPIQSNTTPGNVVVNNEESPNKVK